MTRWTRLWAALLVVSALAGCASSSSAPARGSRDTSVATTTPRVAVQAVPEATPAAPAPPAAPPAARPPTQSFSVGPAVPPTAPPPTSPPAIAQAPAAPPAPAPPTTPKRFVVFNFDNADVEVVIQAASEIVGFNYVLAPAARGRKVTVQTTGRIASDEVFNVLLTILDVNGLAAVRSGNLYRIIPKEGATQSPVVTVIGRDPDTRLAADQVVTQVIPLQYLSATDAATLVRPFVPAQGNVTAIRDGNFLMITDTAANVSRVLDLVKLADVPVAVDEVQIIPVTHADAQELAQLLGQLFASGRLRTAVPGAPAPPPVPPRPPGTPAPARPPGAPADGGTDLGPLIVGDRRTNSLVVQAKKQDMEAIRRLVQQLDVDIYGGQRVFIYFAENSKAKDLASTLDAIYGRGTGPAVTGGTGTTPGGIPGQTPLRGSGLGLDPTRSGLPLPGQLGRPGSFTAPGGPRSSLLPSAGGDEAVTLAGDLRFVADETTNAVIVTTYPRLWKEIEATIKTLDRMPRQVLVEVLAAEITLTDEMSLGVAWALRRGRYEVSSTPFPGAAGGGMIPGKPLQNFIPFGGATPFTGLNFFTFATDAFIAFLNAQASESKVNVLSNPMILTAENKKAVINVSTSVPIVTSQQVPVAAGGDTGNSITQTVEYRDAGIILTVTPRIGEGGTVALEVKQEVNEVGQNEPPPINSPRFTKREAETTVVLLDSQTLVLGGLIQTKRSNSRTGIPFLYKIPVIGYLFGAVDTRLEKTELILVITPRVIGTALDAARVTEELKKSSERLDETLKKAPRPPAPPGNRVD
ncbi:MAG: type II secretion system secretin GspD [Candidatus Rokubacteria bacterium]|nr:type II secretion system secretin GspD [Candidatus Rokubacteria bacterium]